MICLLVGFSPGPADGVDAPAFGCEEEDGPREDPEEGDVEEEADPVITGLIYPVRVVDVYVFLFEREGYCEVAVVVG